MQDYKREISTKLLLLRGFIILAALLCIYLTYIDSGDYAFVLAFVLILCSVFPISGLWISSSDLRVKQYYAFGLFWKTQIFPKNECAELRAIHLESSDNTYMHSGEWWDLFSFFLPSVKIKENSYEIIHTDIFDNKTRIHMKLSDTELRLLKNFVPAASTTVSSS